MPTHELAVALEGQADLFFGMCRQELTLAYEQESRSLYREQGRLEEELAGCAGHHGGYLPGASRAGGGGLWPIEAGDSNDSGSSAKLSECANQST